MIFFSCSKFIEFTNFENGFKNFFVRADLCTGQLSIFMTLFTRSSLSLFSSLHSNIMCSTVWGPLPHEHSGLLANFSLWRYELMFPWPVTIVVKFGVRLILVVSLLPTVGKNSFVIVPFEVSSHLCCHSFSVSLLS